MKKLTIAVLAMLAFGAANVSAQSANGSASVTIPTVLVVSNVTALNISSGFDFSSSNTASASGTVDITTRANILHAVDVTGTAITDGSSSLVFQVNDSGGTPQTVDVSTPVKALASLARGSQTNTITFTATADVATNDPGTYSGTITYTVVANY